MSRPEEDGRPLSTPTTPMRDTTGRTLLGTGRASWVFDLEDGTVLRRRRDLSSTELEAEAMRWVRAHGVPTPRVVAASGPDLIMERVQGPTLHDQLQADPSIASKVGDILAALHHSLDRVPPREGLPTRHAAAHPHATIGVLHGDLHPANVIQSPTGPVLVDWTNVGLGPRAADVAETWIVLLCADPGLGPSWTRIRQQVLDSLLAGVDRAAAQQHLALAATTRLRDPGTSEPEKRSIRALLT